MSAGRKISRRDFVRKSAIGAAGLGLATLTASEYSRVMGANSRLRIGIIGPGRRGQTLLKQVGRLKDEMNAEVVAVCDLWSYYRNMGADLVTKLFGKAPKKFQYYEKMLAMKDLDGVIIATGDFQHALILVDVIKAGKDAYCEKPMANVLSEAKLALETWEKSDRIVQIGTQRRSDGHYYTARDIIRSGILGKISKIEITWNYNGPRWHNDRPEVYAALREEDTDWKRWLLNKPYRPFSKDLYLEYRIYKEFSTGIPDQWMSHIIDIVHMMMDENFPRSVVSNGGIFVWKEARQSPDTFHTIFEYPKEFLVSYATSFGNEYPNKFIIMGTNGTLDVIKWEVNGLGGKMRHKVNPDQIKEPIKVEPKGEFIPPKTDISAMSQPWPGHMKNWLECMRTRRQPNATVWNGYCMSVAVIMSTMALDEGRKKYWDPIKHTICDEPPII